jgi:hypothetical protein
MKTVWYNNHKVCEVTPLEYEALCLLLPYWGMQMDEEKATISGALSTFMLGIQGLSQQKVKELKQLLEHTGITIITDDHIKCDQRFYVDFQTGHPMPLALNTPDKQLYYLNPATSFRFPVQSAIHKGITLKRKDGPLFLAVQPAFEKQVAEWICYLVIQTFLRFSFESLTSIKESTFLSCADKVLNHVNASLAAVQIPQMNKSTPIETPVEKKTEQPVRTEVIKEDVVYEEEKHGTQIKKLDAQIVPVPQIRPFSSSGSLVTKQLPKPYDKNQLVSRNAQPINPFKSVTKNEHPIQPFKPNSNVENQKSVIRPFHSNQNTPSLNREYNDNTSRIFRQRRDGK